METDRLMADGVWDALHPRPQEWDQMKKTELLQALQHEYGRWETLLQQIGESRMEEPGVNGTWSMKDLIAHLTGWNRSLVANLQAAQRGEPKPPPPWPDHCQTEHEVNAWIYESNCNRSLGEVLGEMRELHQQLVSEIAALPNDAGIEKVDPNYLLLWVNGQRFQVTEFFDHYYDDHDADVRAWLKQAGGPRRQAG